MWNVVDFESCQTFGIQLSERSASRSCSTSSPTTVASTDVSNWLTDGRAGEFKLPLTWVRRGSTAALCSCFELSAFPQNTVAFSQSSFSSNYCCWSRQKKDPESISLLTEPARNEDIKNKLRSRVDYFILLEQRKAKPILFHEDIKVIIFLLRLLRISANFQTLQCFIFSRK